MPESGFLKRTARAVVPAVAWQNARRLKRQTRGLGARWLMGRDVRPLSYVWGFDRGAGATTANFGAIGLPNIIFDSVVVVLPDGTGQVVTLEMGTPVPTPLPAGAITIDGNTFTAMVPLSMLPSQGFATADYTQNLWPRYGGIETDDQISDFAPDASMAAPTGTVADTPGPSSW